MEDQTDKGKDPLPAKTGTGTLYLVATPIGNKGDMSPRAAGILAAVDYIAAEDTRRAARLLSSLGVGNRLVSYFEHNKEIRHDSLLQDLAAGQSIAVISDAGMPCISDPGEALVRLALEKGIPVSVIPGPSALLSAVAASGFDTRRFAYEGFIPARGQERARAIAALAGEGRTAVFYEAPHRLRRTLADLGEAVAGDRRLALARELTKAYEEFLYFTVEAALGYYGSVTPRGEFTLVLEGLDEYRRRTGKDESAWTEGELVERLRQVLAEGPGTREAVRRVAEETGTGRNRLYSLALGLAGDPEADGNQALDQDEI